MIAERFISQIEENNLIIRKFEKKSVENIPFEFLFDQIDYSLGDDYENLYEAGISYTFNDDWFSIDVDKLIEKFETYIEDYSDDEDEEYIIKRLKDCIKFLEPYKEFIIYNCL